MTRKRHTSGEVAKLGQDEVLTAQGRPVVKAIGVMDVTFYRWRALDAMQPIGHVCQPDDIARGVLISLPTSRSSSPALNW